MASKQLGKLRQWAGEVISTRDKATVSEEFRELEKDIALRKEGVERLYASSETYKASLVRKKDSDALDDSEKLLPIDALGVVMIIHGEEFGPDSVFGASLVKLGRAHSKIATLQEAYALTFEATFMASTKRFVDDIKDYEMQRKKLESRRLSYDAAITKLEKVKSSKKEKEKDKREAEDELQKARLRYEETSEDVRARIHAIQENEVDQLHELTNFLDMELNFMEQYVEVLKDVKSDWFDESQITKPEALKLDGPSHIFARPGSEPKFSSVRSRRSRSRVPGNDLTAGTQLSDASDGEETLRRRNSRKASTTRALPLQLRSASTASRRRSDSAPTAEGTDKENKDKDRSEKGRSLSVAGWASNAVGSVTGRGKKSRDKEKFAALKDGGDRDDDGDRGELQRSSSAQSFTTKRVSKSKSKENITGSPKVPPRILRPPSLQDKKLVRALHDFAGSSDELSFRAGDQIVVVNEVLDGWWMGELDGRKGLFPTPYTEVISPKRQRVGVRTEDNTSLSSKDDSSQENDADGYGESEPEHDHIYSAHHLVTAHSLRSPFSIQSDTASVTSSVAEEEEKKALMPSKASPDQEDFPRSRMMPHSFSSPMPLASATEPNFHAPASGRKVPPPPPPRRSTNNLLVSTPPIPERRPKEARSHSSGSLPKSNLNLDPSASSVSSREYDTSPFESAAEIPGMQCRSFKQNPYKPRGMCSNCLEMHE